MQWGIGVTYKFVWRVKLGLNDKGKFKEYQRFSSALQKLFVCLKKIGTSQISESFIS